MISSSTNPFAAQPEKTLKQVEQRKPVTSKKTQSTNRKHEDRAKIESPNKATRAPPIVAVLGWQC